MKTMVTVHHERCLRDQAVENPRLEYLNVSVNGLTGKRHPIMYNIESTYEAERARVHIKMLSGDYPCFENLARDGNVPPFCRICSPEIISGDPPTESLAHVLSHCVGTSGTRSRLLPDLLNTIASVCPDNPVLNEYSHMTQFILDPTSLNLPLAARISPENPTLSSVLSCCRNFAYQIHKDRIRLLRSL